MERKGFTTYDAAAARGPGGDGRQLLHPSALRPRAARRGAPLRALRLLRHQRRPHPRGPRSAEGVGRGVSGSAPERRPAPHAVLRAARGGRRPDGGLRRLGDAGAVPDRHPRGAPGHAQRAPACSTCRTWAASCCAAPARSRFLQHVAHQQRRGARPAAGAVHDHAHPHRRRRRRRLPVPLRGGRVPAGRQRRQPRQGLGALPAAPARGSRTWSSTDETGEIAMLALQGRRRATILAGLIEHGLAARPVPQRAEHRHAERAGPSAGRPARAVRLARTGYTGEPLCFELFVPPEDGPARLGRAGGGAAPRPSASAPATPCASRPACRCTATSSGLDPEGHEIPIMSCPLATFAVSFSPLKGDFVGRAALERAARGLRAHPGARLLAHRRPAAPHAAGGRDRARHRPRGLHGAEPDGERPRLGHQRHGGALLGRRGRGPLLARAPTSTTCAPSPWPTSTAAWSRTTRWSSTCAAAASPASSCRTTCAATPRRAPAPSSGTTRRSSPSSRAARPARRRSALLHGAVANHEWRQQQCINLIPSEMTASPMVRLLSVMDPSFRYAEHKKTKAFYDLEVFYYQGTEFIHEVERLLRNELRGVSRLPRGGDPRHQRPDGQHRRVQRHGGLPQPRRPQGRAAAHRQGDEQPHRPGRPPERPADGRPAGLRGPRPAHRAAGGRRLPRAAGQPLQGRRARAPRPHRAGAPGADHLRQEHGAAPGAGGRGAHLPRRHGHPRCAHVRHGPRAGPGRPALPAAVQRGRRHRHRVHAQDVLRHAARHRRRAVGRRRRRSTTSGRRSSGAPSPAR